MHALGLFLFNLKARWHEWRTRTTDLGSLGNLYLDRNPWQEALRREQLTLGQKRTTAETLY